MNVVVPFRGSQRRVSGFTVGLRELTPVGAFTARIVKGPIHSVINAGIANGKVNKAGCIVSYS